MSARGKLDGTDIRKIGKGAVIAAAGAGIAYLGEAIAQRDWGDWAPVVTAGAAVVVNVLRKWLAGGAKDASGSVSGDPNR